MDKISLALLVAIGLFALVDFIPRLFIAKIRQPKVAPSFTKTPDYLILPTVYGDISYLKNLSFLKKYGKHVVVCTSSYETPEFYRALRKACRQNGLRYTVADVPVSGKTPLRNPYTIYRGVFTSGKLRINNDTPCLLLDADTYAVDNVNNLVRAFVASGFDTVSLRCEVSNPQNTIEILQAFEYKIAMDGRNMDPWLTSGACNLSKASVMKSVFARHSNFFIGGDIEIGKLAKSAGYKVGHLDFIFYTVVPAGVREWFWQRVLWFSGGIRHHVINISSFGWHHFFLLFYNSLLIYLLFPLRWIEFVNLPFLLPLTVLFSWLYVVILTGIKNWRPAYLMLPIYSFVQTMIILPFAFVKYVRLAWQHKSLGLLQHDFSRHDRSQAILFRTLNYGAAMMVIVAAYAFTTARLEYWSEHSTLLSRVMHFFSTLL